MLNLFSLFKRKVLSSLENINEEVSSYNKYEFETVIAVVPNISYAVSHYASYSLPTNVQFYAIENIMQ